MKFKTKIRTVSMPCIHADSAVYCGFVLEDLYDGFSEALIFRSTVLSYPGNSSVELFLSRGSGGQVKYDVAPDGLQLSNWIPAEIEIITYECKYPQLDKTTTYYAFKIIGLKDIASEDDLIVRTSNFLYPGNKVMEKYAMLRSTVTTL